MARLYRFNEISYTHFAEFGEAFPRLSGLINYGTRQERQNNPANADIASINQHDVAEKSSQVSQMSLVYRNSAQGIIWLGEVVPYRDRHTNALHEDLAGFALHQVFETIIESYPKATVTYQGHGPYSKREIKRMNLQNFNWIKYLFTRDWFTRRWCIQEVAVPWLTKVLSGPYRINWGWIGLTAAILRMSPTSLTSVELNMKPGNIPPVVTNAYLMYRLTQSTGFGRPQMTFLHLLRLAASVNVSNPRDAVYALVGMVTSDHDPENSPLVKVDYDLSEKEFCMQILLDLMWKDKSLAFLSSACRTRCLRNDSSEIARSINDFPSRLPRWSLPEISYILGPWSTHESYLPCKGLQNEIQAQIQDDTLIAPALEVSTVFWNGKAMVRDDDAIFEALNELVTTMQFDAKQSSRLAMTFAAVLTAGRDVLGGIQRDKKVQLADYPAWRSAWSHQNKEGASIEAHTATTDLEETGDASRFQQIASQVCIGRLLFVTVSGHICLGPAYTMPGDRVCILDGHKMPVVLRPKEDGYTFVGDCFVHGLMWGEAVEEMANGRSHFGPLGLLKNTPLVEAIRKDPIMDGGLREVVDELTKLVVDSAEARYAAPREVVFQIK